MTWRVHGEIEQTSRRLQRGVVRLYPERARRVRHLAIGIALIGALLIAAAFEAGRLIYLLMTC